MSVIVHLADELAGRLLAEAERRGLSDELSDELNAAGPPAGPASDALEAFIGSGRSGRSDLGRRHREIKTQITESLTP